MSQKNIRAVVMYHGGNFKGSQIQKTGRTVQGAFEGALNKIASKNIRIHCASRTDGGVHAEGQVIAFKMESALTAPTFKKALNFHLPKDVAVKSVSFQDNGFHARFNAKAKHYRYQIYMGRLKPVFDAERAWWMNRKLDAGKMRAAAKALIGLHDFSSFCGPTDASKRKVKKLSSIRITQSKDFLIWDFKGDGFLKYMIRIIVGTLVEVGLGKRPPEEIKQILESKDRRLAGQTAPAHGLTLVKVYY